VLILRVILRVNIFPIVHPIVKVVPNAVVNNEIVFGQTAFDDALVLVLRDLIIYFCLFSLGTAKGDRWRVSVASQRVYGRHRPSILADLLVVPT
jgi:hypothetical protein